MFSFVSFFSCFDKFCRGQAVVTLDNAGRILETCESVNAVTVHLLAFSFVFFFPFSNRGITTLFSNKEKEKIHLLALIHCRVMSCSSCQNHTAPAPCGASCRCGSMVQRPHDAPSGSAPDSVTERQHQP